MIMSMPILFHSFVHFFRFPLLQHDDRYELTYVLHSGEAFYLGCKHCRATNLDPCGYSK